MRVAIADLRRGFRILRRNPGFAAIAIATLGLGIGLNCAAFTLVNTLLLHSPPYAQAERIVELREKNAARGLTQQLVSVPDYWDWRESNRAFENIAAWNFQYFNLTGADEPERVEGLTVTSDYFSVLRIQPALGRDFLPEDEQPGNTHVAILSDSLWRRRFGMDPSVIGRTVAIEDEPYMVVGVLPDDFRLFRVLNRDLDVFVPQTLGPSHASRADHLLFVYGRLRPGISIEQARSQMEATAAALARQHPETNLGWTVELQELHRQWTAQSRPTFLLLQGAAGFVLLIACANLAGMLLARALERQREMAIRIALGAGRICLLWQLLAENFALAVLSGIAGLGVGMALIRLMNRLPYTAVNRVEPFRLDGRVLAFGLVLAAMAALLVGIGAALQCSTRNLKPVAVRGRRMGNVLVFSQIALTAVLLSGAGLLVRSSLLVNGMSRGLDPHHLLSAQIWLPPARYASGDQIVRFSRDAVGRVSALPGVRSASAVNFPALSVLSTSVGIQVEGQSAPRRGDEPVTQYWVIGPAYFETTRIPVLSGRTFDEHDSDESDGVVVVSASMAERFWPGQTALGKRIRPLFPSTAHYWLPKSRTRWLAVVGIVGNVRLDGIALMPLPQMYLSYRQYPTSILHLLARTAGDPMRLAGAVRHEIAGLDRDQPVFDIKSMEEVLADSTTRASLLTWLLSAFAAVAVLLAALGIYGVTACWTSRRTREIGVRMALGANPAQVVRLIACQGLPAMVGGAGAGLGGALLAGRVLKSVLVGVSTTDLLTFAAVPAVLLFAAVAAASLPARRASAIDPMAALRHE